MLPYKVIVTNKYLTGSGVSGEAEFEFLSLADAKAYATALTTAYTEPRVYIWDGNQVLFYGSASPVAGLVSAFVTRVETDGGTVESQSCLTSDLEYLTQNPEPSAFDTDYQAVLDRSTTLGYTAPSEAQQTLQNTLVTDLKTAGVWDKLDVFYVFATDGDSDYATLNWKAPSSHQTTKVNSPTFTANGGFTGDGSSSYLDTNFDPDASGVNYTLNDASISIWNNTFVLNNFITGLDASAYNCLRMSSLSANIRINMDINSLSPVVDFSDSNKTFRQLNRTSLSNVTAFQNTTSTTHSGASTSIEGQNQLILKASTFYSSTEVAFFGMGASLVSENADFYSALNTYKSAL